MRKGRFAGALCAALLAALIVPAPTVASTLQATSSGGLSANPRPAPAASPSPTPTPSTSKRSKVPLAPNLATPAAGWGWQNPKPNANGLFAISCPTTTTCYAAGQDGPILHTVNGGVNWAQQANASGVFGMSCPSASVCVAVGANGLVLTTADSGTTWTPKTINAGHFLISVACTSTVACIAVGQAGSIVATTDGGATWAPQTSGTTVDNLFSISCPSASTCFAVGDAGLVIKTTNAGASWATVQSGTVNGLNGIDCVDTTHCTAVGLNGTTISTNNGGIPSWGIVNVGAPVDLVGVDCWTASDCIATAYDGNAYIMAGYRWGAATTGETGVLWAVSCPAARTCFVAGDFGLVISTLNGGTGWGEQSPGPPANGFYSISCPTTTLCFAVGGDQITMTADGWATWSSQTAPSPPSGADLRGISCASATTCFAVGSAGYVGSTTDGGAHWSAQTAASQTLHAISCPSTSACFAVGDNGTVIATTDGGSHWASQTTPTTGIFKTISCSTTSACMAATETDLYATTDGGATWNLKPAYGTKFLYSVNCASATTCVVVGYYQNVGGVLVDTTTDGGASWVDRAPFPEHGTQTAVSCPSTTTCFAVGLNVLATTDFVNWGYQVSQPASWTAISCPSTTTCFAVSDLGDVMRTTNGGSTWLFVAPSRTNMNLAGVSCPTTTTCFAVGWSDQFHPISGAYGTTDAGAHWSQLYFDNASQLSAISCPSTTECIAAGTDQYGSFMFRTTDGGISWGAHIGVGFGPPVIGVSCPSVSTCFAGNNQGGVTKTTDGGASWSQFALATNQNMSAINCPSVSTCFATDNATPGHIITTADGGSNWTVSFDLAADPLAGSPGPFRGIDCFSTVVCNAVGNAGLIVTTTNGGANWRTDNVASPANVISISCPSVSTCFAGTDASVILTSSDFGGNWVMDFGANVYVGGPTSNAFSAISCPAVAACFAVGIGGIIAATTNGGAAWTPNNPAGSTNHVLGLSCPDTSNCYAAAIGFGLAGDGVLVTHNGGATWALHTLNQADQVDAISCPSAGTCFAVGWPGAIYRTTDGGTTWDYQTTAFSGSDTALLGVSCANSISCTAVGATGRVLSTADGSTWTAQSSGTSYPLIGVSCPSANVCVAVGAGGLTLARTAGVWHAHASGTTRPLFGVSCPSISVCDAVGVGGTVIRTANGGTNWTAQASGTTADLFAISCSNSSRCLAVGDLGTALLTKDGAHWTDRSPPTLNVLRAVAFVDPEHAWVAGLGGSILANASVIEFCSSVSLSFAQPSPQTVGTAITLNAAAIGCVSPQFKFFVQPPGGSYVAQTAYGASSWTWNTTGLAPGVYGFSVWARQAGSSAAYESYFLETFTLTIQACSAASLSPGTAPPQAPGASITFTGSATGCSTPEFKFFVLAPGGVWTLKRDWGIGTWSWSTAGLAAGTYQFSVWARQRGSKSAYDAFGLTTYALGTAGCISAGMSADVGPPQPPGTTVTFAATSSTCSGPVYQFWLRAPGGAWTVKKPFSTSATWAWSTTGLAPGTYQVEVWVKQSGSTAVHDAYFVGTYQLVVPTCTSAGIVATPVSPARAGTSVVLNASAIGCLAPRYEFWEQPPGGTWTIVQPYGAPNSFSWDTTGASGIYRFSVWAKDATSRNRYDTYAQTTFWVGN